MPGSLQSQSESLGSSRVGSPAPRTTGTGREGKNGPSEERTGPGVLKGGLPSIPVLRPRSSKSEEGPDGQFDPVFSSGSPVHGGRDGRRRSGSFTPSRPRAGTGTEAPPRRCRTLPPARGRGRWGRTRPVRGPGSTLVRGRKSSLAARPGKWVHERDAAESEVVRPPTRSPGPRRTRPLFAGARGTVGCLRKWRGTGRRRLAPLTPARRLLRAPCRTRVPARGPSRSSCRGGRPTPAPSRSKSEADEGLRGPPLAGGRPSRARGRRPDVYLRPWTRRRSGPGVPGPNPWREREGSRVELPEWAPLIRGQCLVPRRYLRCDSGDP